MVFLYFLKVHSLSCKTSSKNTLIIISTSSFIVQFVFVPLFLFLSTLSFSFWLLVHISNPHLFPQECNLCFIEIAWNFDTTINRVHVFACWAISSCYFCNCAQLMYALFYLISAWNFPLSYPVKIMDIPTNTSMKLTSKILNKVCWKQWSSHILTMDFVW